MVSYISLLLAALTASVSASVENPSISPRPPMGFNNWARFQCALNETLFVKTAEAMVAKGLLAAGYKNINMDDCWSLYNRSSPGQLQWNPAIFPHGLPWLANYLHTRGFNFGMYTNAGNMSCGGYPGSQDHEETDAMTLQSWGVDYLKIDGCHVDLQHGRDNFEEFKYRYQLWHQIMTTKLTKPFIFSQSAPAYFSPNFITTPNYTDWYRTMDYIPSNGELARHSDDIKVYSTLANNSFEPGGHWESMMNNYGMEVRLSRYQSCGYYNDPDFLIVDWPDLSLDEKKTHMALWSSFSAPLILSAYIPDLTAEEVAYLTNKDIIDVDQDALCEQATLVSQDGYIDVLTKNLANGDRLLTVLNKGNKTNSTTIPLERLGIDPEASYSARDLWANTTATIKTSITVKLRTHQTGIYRISSSSPITVSPTGQIFNTFSLNCLTAKSSRKTSFTVEFCACDGSDGQIWVINANGTINSLLSLNRYLTVEDSDLALKTVVKGSSASSQIWTYDIQGNLLNNGTGLALQEGNNGAAKASKLGVEKDSQVFALPGGVKLS